MEYTKEDLQKLWGRKDKVIFPSYKTVTAVALEKLFDKLPQKFFKKVDNAPQKSKYRKKRLSLTLKLMYVWKQPTLITSLKIMRGLRYCHSMYRKSGTER